MALRARRGSLSISLLLSGLVGLPGLAACMVDSGEEGFKPNAGGSAASGAGTGGAGGAGASAGKSSGGTFAAGGSPSTGGSPPSAGGRGGSGGGSSAGAGGGSNGGGGSAGTGGLTFTDVFDSCRFHFGMDHNQWTNNKVEEVEYLSAWAGSGEDFNLGWMFNDFKPGAGAEHMLPVLYGYVIAFTSRRDQGLCDCNVTCQTSNENLCSAGAQYLRDHLYDRVIPQYEKYAQGVASSYGTQKPVIWLMEPDFYQYATPGSQKNNPLSFEEAGDAMEAIVGAIKAVLPNSVFSLDISPWMSQEVFSDWISHFPMEEFTFMNTSGGATRGDLTNIRQGQLTWKFVSQTTGKPIIADASYCGGNECQGLVHDDRWDDANNLNDRIGDGVVAITHVMVPDQWSQTITNLRTALDAPDHCP
jgi:hypothetical protein